MLILSQPHTAIREPTSWDPESFTSPCTYEIITNSGLFPCLPQVPTYLGRLCIDKKDQGSRLKAIPNNLKLASTRDSPTLDVNLSNNSLVEEYVRYHSHCSIAFPIIEGFRLTVPNPTPRTFPWYRENTRCCHGGF